MLRWILWVIIQNATTGDIIREDVIIPKRMSESKCIEEQMKRPAEHTVNNQIKTYQCRWVEEV